MVLVESNAYGSSIFMCTSVREPGSASKGEGREVLRARPFGTREHADIHRKMPARPLDRRVDDSKTPIPPNSVALSSSAFTTEGPLLEAANPCFAPIVVLLDPNLISSGDAREK